MPGQYFEAQPSVVSRPGTVELDLDGAPITLAVDRGVFAASRVDPGTLVLLRQLPPMPVGPALDLGCGYGAIACTLARRDADREVWAVDVNERAVALTRANADALGLERVHAAAPEGVPAGLRFAAIVSNPPIRIGKEALHDLLARWLPTLDEGGEAWLVVQRHLGADSLAAWLASGAPPGAGPSGWVVERRASKRGYRVLRVHR